MECQKIINFLDDTTNQPPEFRTRNWVEINDESQGMYNVSNQVKFNNSVIRSNLSDYSDACIHGEGAINVPNTGIAPALNNRNKQLIFKNCSPFVTCIREINNTQVDDAHDIHVVMPMYNLTECIDTYSKIKGILWQYYRDETSLNNNGIIIDFSAESNNSNSFKPKHQKTGSNRKYWNKICLNIGSIKISKNCFLVTGTAANQEPTFRITDAKLYVPVVTLST